MNLSILKKLLTPSLSDILNFDRNGFIANLGQLLSDGIQCGKKYAVFTETDISAYEQYLGMLILSVFCFNLTIQTILHIFSLQSRNISKSLTDLPKSNTNITNSETMSKIS